jgi:hypothetical protein
VRNVVADSGASLQNKARTGGMLEAKLRNGFGEGMKMMFAQESRPGGYHLCRISESGRKACS